MGRCVNFLRSKRFTCVVFHVNLAGEESPVAGVVSGNAAQKELGMSLSTVSFVFLPKLYIK